MIILILIDNNFNINIPLRKSIAIKVGVSDKTEVLKIGLYSDRKICELCNIFRDLCNS